MSSHFLILKNPICKCAGMLKSCLTHCNPMVCSPLGFSSMGFSRQEYWSGLPCPPPGDFPHPGIEPRSPTLQVDSLPSKPPGKPYMISTLNLRNLFHICDKLRYFPATKHIPYWKNCAKSSLYKWLSITIGTLICFCHCYFF